MSYAKARVDTERAAIRARCSEPQSQENALRAKQRLPEIRQVNEMANQMAYAKQQQALHVPQQAIGQAK